MYLLSDTHFLLLVVVPIVHSENKFTFIIKLCIKFLCFFFARFKMLFNIVMGKIYSRTY